MKWIIFKYNKGALTGGAAITILGITAAIILGHTSGYKAQKLLEDSSQNINTLCNTVILASATILALLFTVLGLSSGTDISLKKSFYHRIHEIALFDTIVFILTMFIFLTLNFPIAESEKLPLWYFQVLYYITVVSASLIGGLIVIVITMLYLTVRDLIQIVGLGSEEHPMADVEGEMEDEDDK